MNSFSDNLETSWKTVKTEILKQNRRFLRKTFKNLLGLVRL